MTKPRRPLRSDKSEVSIITAIDVMKINGYQMVTGLLWQPLNNPRNYMSEARSLGKKHNMDIVAVRTGRHCQAGFVSKSQGVTKTMYSLAATLAGLLGDDWLGIFTIPTLPGDEKRYVFIAVAEGSIVPGCDMCGSYDEVVTKAQQSQMMLGTDDNPMDIYAPEEFDFLGLKDSLTLDELIIAANIKKEYRLRALQFGLSKEELTVLGLAAVIALILLYMGHLYFQRKNEEAKIRELQKQAELEEMQKRSATQLKSSALAHPWAKGSLASEFIIRCNYSVDNLPLSVAGWVFSEAVCKQSGIEIKYSNSGVSTVNKFIDELSAHGATAAIDESGSNASMVLPINIPVSDEALLPTSDRLNSFISMFQELGLPISLQKQPDPVPPPQADPNQPPPPAPDWSSFSFKVESEIEPLKILNGGNDNGVRIDSFSVKLDKSRLIYAMEGTLYAKK